MSHKKRRELLLLFQAGLLSWNLISNLLASRYSQILLFEFVLKFSYFIKTIVFVFLLLSKLSASFAFNLRSWIRHRLRNWIFAFFVTLSLRLNWLCEWRLDCLAGRSLVLTGACIKYGIKLCCRCWPFWWLGIQINRIIVEIHSDLYILSWHLDLRCILLFSYWWSPFDRDTW